MHKRIFHQRLQDQGRNQGAHGFRIDVFHHLEAVTERLQVDGVAAFATSFDALLEGLESRRRAQVAGG